MSWTSLLFGMAGITDEIRDAHPGYHVTGVRNGGVYGHSTECCDESGCAGYERFLGAAPKPSPALGEDVDHG